MLTSLDITRILAESAGTMIGATITAVEYYRKERTVQVYLKKDRTVCITLSFHPQQSGFYVLPAAKSRLDTPEKHRPFARELWDGTLISVKQTLNDRIVELEIGVSAKTWYLVFEIIGPNANVWQLDGDKAIFASLRQKSFSPGQPYQPPALPDKLDPAAFTSDDIRRLLDAEPEAVAARALEKGIYGVDYYLARSVIPGDEKRDPQSAPMICDRLREVIDRHLSPDNPVYAYYIKGKSRFYPVEIAGHELVGKFGSLSAAQREVNAGIRQTVDIESLREQTLKSIRGRIKKAERALERLETDIAEASGFEQYRRFADLLKINLGRLKRGMDKIEADDLFAGGAKVVISLDSKLNGSENVEQYSRRYRKGKEGLDLLTRRKENLVDEIKMLETALGRFEGNFDEAQHEYPELLPTPLESGFQETVVRRPYKEYQTSTGVTLWVGKTEADNDRLTLDYAKPHELWFHASQCPGSHVVMKFPNKSFVPSKQEITEAASLAAYFSKARGSTKVPVSFTQRRYVRKPRKAKPGLVTIERHETIMVPPKELAKKE